MCYFGCAFTPTHSLHLLSSCQFLLPSCLLHHAFYPCRSPQVGWSSRSAVSSPSWSPEHSEAFDGFKIRQQSEFVWTARLVNDTL